MPCIILAMVQLVVLTNVLWTNFNFQKLKKVFGCFKNLSWAYLVATNEKMTQLQVFLLSLYLVTICNLNNNIVPSLRCIQFLVLHMNISRAYIQFSNNNYRPSLYALLQTIVFDEGV